MGGQWLCFSTVTMVRCRSTQTCQSVERSMNGLFASVEGNVPIIMRLERHSPSGKDAHGKAARNCSLSGAACTCMHACLPARASRRPVEFIRPHRWFPNAMRPSEPRPPCEFAMRPSERYATLRTPPIGRAVLSRRSRYPKHPGRACGRWGMGRHRRRTRRRLRLDDHWKTHLVE